MTEPKKRGEKAMGGKKSSKSKGKKSSGRVKEIHLRRADSGEMLAKHVHHNRPGEPPMEDEEHVVPEGGLDEHAAMHLPPQQEGAAPAGAQPNPMGGTSMIGGM